jgi:hypothetical protein
MKPATFIERLIQLLILTAKSGGNGCRQRPVFTQLRQWKCRHTVGGTLFK